MPNQNPTPEIFIDALESLRELLRLRLIGVLAETELSVSEMCDILSAAQSTISRHLKVLTDGGWLVCRKSGTSRHYALAKPLSDALQSLYVILEKQLENWPQAEEDKRRVQQLLRQRLNEGSFAHPASEWEQRREAFYGRVFQTEALLGMLPRDWHVADFGCATGGLSEVLARQFDKVTAIDISQDMVDATAQRTKDHAHVTALKADLTDLPIADATFDGAWCVLVMAYLPDVPTFLAEARRVLKPGANLVLIEAAPYHDAALRQEIGQLQPGLAQERMVSLCQAAGFSAYGRSIPADLSARLSALWVIQATAI